MTLKWTILIAAFLLGGALFINSCKKSSGGDAVTSPIKFTIPEGFPPPVYTFATNPLTEQGFALGRKLFYDGKLSKDGNFPCASCHQQFAAFSTLDHDLSHGFNNQFTTRNAQGLYNLVWGKEMHWDGGINNLEVQPLAPITAPNEMAEDINNIVKKLEADPNYPKMFTAAFGSGPITSQKIMFALTQFVGSIVSSDSKYDKVRKGQATFNTNEQNGYQIFKAKCTSCHKEPLFTDFSFRNTGIPVNSFLKDYGRMRSQIRKKIH